MQLELVPEEEMVKKPKKEAPPRDTDIKIIHKPRDSKGTVPIIKNEDMKGGEEKAKEETKEEVSGGISPGMVIKRIYFPNNIYSNAANQTGFKSILKKFGLSWVSSSMKDYFGNDRKQLRTGTYVTESGDKKIFAIYEGSEKPATFIVKIIGSGGNFLLELNSFCHNIGCVIEDKNEAYINNVMLILHERGELYVEKTVENTTLEDLQRAQEEEARQQKEREEKIQKIIDDAVERFIEAHKFYYDDRCECLFWRRGLDIAFVRKFRRMEMERDIRRNYENEL